MNQEEIKNNILAPDQWIRILFMAGYALAAWAVLIVLLLTLLIQLVMVLIQGRANRNLQKTSFAWTAYLQQIIHYLTYISNDKPFPFMDFPGSEGLSDIAPEPPEQASGNDGEGQQQQSAPASASNTATDTPVYDDVPSFSTPPAAPQTDAPQTGADTGDTSTEQDSGQDTMPAGGDSSYTGNDDKDLPPR